MDENLTSLLHKQMLKRHAKQHRKWGKVCLCKGWNCCPTIPVYHGQWLDFDSENHQLMVHPTTTRLPPAPNHCEIRVLLSTALWCWMVWLLNSEVADSWFEKLPLTCECKVCQISHKYGTNYKLEGSKKTFIRKAILYFNCLIFRFLVVEYILWFQAILETSVNWQCITV